MPELPLLGSVTRCPLCEGNRFQVHTKYIPPRVTLCVLCEGCAEVRVTKYKDEGSSLFGYGREVILKPAWDGVEGVSNG